LLESGFNLIGGELCKPFFEEMNFEFDVEVLLL
jgi:hypothetical protein